MNLSFLFFLFFQYYSSLLAEAKSKLENAITDAVEEAVNSKMQDIQNKLQKCIEEKNVVADVSVLFKFPSVIFS